jgi:2-polyprenyl-6-methoxyphenol hydroxylase-like FAD-dependent oxidoreductase
MPHKTEIDALVVGAGPVGMFTALALAHHGIHTRIIDKESRTAGHSYACALHPSSFKLLSDFGVPTDIVERGRRITSVAFYDGTSKRAELALSKIGGDFPFVLVLEQSGLEDLLEETLKRKGIKVEWNQRLQDLQPEDDAVTATVEKFASSGHGYIIPEFEPSVQSIETIRASIVIGADGQNSMVRQRLNIDSYHFREPQEFDVYETVLAEDPGQEMRVVLAAATTNVMWPLTGNKCRWSFQMVAADPPEEFPAKDRERLIMVEPASDRSKRETLDWLWRQRAPWFKATVKEITWGTRVNFDSRLAHCFGKGRCWLAGDSAHQTSPVGMQSMNVGLREAADLAAALKEILHHRAALSLLQVYDAQQLAEWRRLLGLAGGPQVSEKTDDWVQQHRGRIVSSIPASGRDLTLLLKGLGLIFK